MIRLWYVSDKNRVESHCLPLEFFPLADELNQQPGSLQVVSQSLPCLQLLLQSRLFLLAVPLQGQCAQTPKYVRQLNEASAEGVTIFSWTKSASYRRELWLSLWRERVDMSLWLQVCLETNNWTPGGAETNCRCVREFTWACACLSLCVRLQPHVHSHSAPFLCKCDSGLMRVIQPNTTWTQSWHGPTLCSSVGLWHCELQKIDFYQQFMNNPSSWLLLCFVLEPVDTQWLESLQFCCGSADWAASVSDLEALGDSLSSSSKNTFSVMKWILESQQKHDLFSFS